MKTILTLIILLSSFVGFTQEEIEIDTTAHAMYAIVDISKAIEINYTISKAKDYALNKKTSQVFPIIPNQFCLVDSILYSVLKISVKNQQYYSDNLVELSLVNFKDTILTKIEIDLIPDVEKWFFERYIENDNLTIINKKDEK